MDSNNFGTGYHLPIARKTKVVSVSCSDGRFKITISNAQSSRKTGLFGLRVFSALPTPWMDGKSLVATIFALIFDVFMMMSMHRIRFFNLCRKQYNNAYKKLLQAK